MVFEQIVFQHEKVPGEERISKGVRKMGGKIVLPSKIIVLGGFLGSGKTTFLVNIIHKCRHKYNRIVVIENDVGEIGVDGLILDSEGIKVREILGGCICCTLKSDLFFALKEISCKFSPDLLIVELSGVAVPKEVLKTLNNFFKELNKEIYLVTLIDVCRYELLLKMMRPLMIAQIKCASHIIVNKTDKVGRSRVLEILEDVKSLNRSAKIIATSLRDEEFMSNGVL